MIQRIQTVYLLIITILSVVCLSLPVGTFVQGNTISELTNLCFTAPDGSTSPNTWAPFFILGLSALSTFVSIFLFKKRMIQIRFSIFNIILTIGYYATLITFIVMLKGDATFAPNWTICLPFINIIFYWLAIRAIGKDEMLVKAYDRLR